MVLLFLSTVSWIRRCRREESAGDRRLALLRGLGLALPALYVAAVTILFESGENMRYRFFLEPTLFVFFWVSLSSFRFSAAGNPERSIEKSEPLSAAKERPADLLPTSDT